MFKFILLMCILLTPKAYSNTIAVEFVVTSTAGGAYDTTARKISDYLNSNSDLNIFVNNRPGAGHKIGYEYIKTTLKPVLTLLPPNINTYDVISTVDEVYTLGYFGVSIYASTSSNIKNLNDLIILSNRRIVNFGHGGEGTYGHTAMVYLCKDILKCLSVPYKGGSHAMLGVVSNTIDVFATPNYGGSNYMNNKLITLIHTVKPEGNVLRLYSKNLSEKDKNTVYNLMKKLNITFYNEMGFY
jgi:tripartite-type tricarboxylate transporter receptor subunit TctC